MEVDHLGVAVEDGGVESGEAEPVELAEPAFLDDRVGGAGGVVAGLVGEGGPRHRGQLPVDVQDRLHEPAVLEVFGEGDGLAAVVEVVSHVASHAPPGLPLAAELVSVHRLLPELPPLRSYPGFVAVAEAAVPTTCSRRGGFLF